MSTSVPPYVAVVGGGMSGLVAARRLREQGSFVVLLEASPRVGGSVATSTFSGTPIDVGAEAMHLGAGGAAALIDELGLRASMLVAPTGTSWLATPRGLKPLPAGVGPAGPTRIGPVLASGSLSAMGLARAGLEPLRARRGGPLTLGPGQDISVGEFVAARFGDEVAATFVDPLLGSLHAGDIFRLSLRACAPSLLPAATGGESLIVRARQAAAKRAAAGAAAAGSGGAGGAMSFITWERGLSTVTDSVLAGQDVRVRTSTAVDRIERAGYAVGTGYRLHLTSGETFLVDGVVLAVPARVAARLLQPIAPAAATPLSQVETADVATVILGFDAEAVLAYPAFAGTGILVPTTLSMPKSEGATAGGPRAAAPPSLLKAATFLSTKWPHLRGGDTYWLRASVGRAGDHRLATMDDAGVIEHVRRDLRRFTGLDVHPVHASVQRWPQSMPQLTVGHLDRLAAARAAVSTDAGLGAIALAGASYDGIGLGSCITSGWAAAAQVTQDVSKRKLPQGPM